jgi:hypothetical protein
MTPLEFHARQSTMTSPGRYARRLAALPDDLGALARTVQGLAIYDVAARDFYGVDLPRKRADQIHLRRVEDMLGRVLAMDDRPLAQERIPRQRLASRCRGFVALLLSMSRAKGVAARARSGFGAYFNPGTFEDHWACEAWNATTERWVLADPQFDEIWRDRLGVRHDVLDVPRDQFLVAADAWRLCRTGKADASRFGINFGGLRGLWFIAGSLVRDIAALNGVEMLPWDVWGAQPQSKRALERGELEYFDRLAELSRDPDASFAELRRAYAGDERLRVPARVFNVLRQRSESIN